MFLSWHASFIEKTFNLEFLDVPDDLVEEVSKVFLECLFEFEEVVDVVLSALGHVCDGFILGLIELFGVSDLSLGHKVTAGFVEHLHLLASGPEEEGQFLDDPVLLGIEAANGSVEEEVDLLLNFTFIGEGGAVVLGFVLSAVVLGIGVSIAVWVIAVFWS